MDITKYSLLDKYPEVFSTKGDKKYIPLILNDYASGVSEFTAISQYIYSHFNIEQEEDKEQLYKEIADAFIGISIVEMRHLELLADTILKIGGDPKFVNGKNKYWKGNLVPYGKNIKNHLKLAIKSEEDAIIQYEKHIKIIDNVSIKMLLKRIVKDEQLHLEIFKDLLNKLD